MRYRKFVYHAALWVVVAPLLPLYALLLAARAGEHGVGWLMGTRPIQRYVDLVDAADRWLIERLARRD